MASNGWVITFILIYLKLLLVMQSKLASRPLQPYRIPKYPNTAHTGRPQLYTQSTTIKAICPCHAPLLTAGVCPLPVSRTAPSPCTPPSSHIAPPSHPPLIARQVVLERPRQIRLARTTSGLEHGQRLPHSHLGQSVLVCARRPEPETQ